MKYWFILILPSILFAESISEKKTSLSPQEASRGVELGFINDRLEIIKKSLTQTYLKAKDLAQTEASDTDYRSILKQVNALKSEKKELEEKWRESAAKEGLQNSEPASLWDQEEISLTQLIIEYGSSEYLYIIPPEYANFKLHLYSNIPIPRQSWGDLLEIILYHHGFGLRKLNPYARQLYLLKQDLGMLEAIAYRPEQLSILPSGCRLCYLIIPPLEQVRTVYQFFEKFSDNKQTFIHQISNRIAIIGKKEDIEKLLDFYDKIWGSNGGKISRVIPVSKITVKEMEKILTLFFGEALDKNRGSFSKQEVEGMGIFPLIQNNSLVVIGSKESVERAQKIVKETEAQLEDPTEMTIYLYSCKHSDPTDLSQLLDKVYHSLLTIETNPNGELRSSSNSLSSQKNNSLPPVDIAASSSLAVSPPALQTDINFASNNEKKVSHHFIPDLKTGTILMTVRKDALEKIHDLLKKLDIPKKMVEIEVLLFERRINSQNNFGMNLLKLGNPNCGATYISQYGVPVKNETLCKGVLQFFFRGEGSGCLPKFDIAYNFLMSQDDIQLNAAPSVTTINQTPSKISIVEELSINKGATPIETQKGAAFQKSFERVQYGITIVLTPTIHTSIIEGEKGWITLQTNITFDTTQPNPDDRPSVDRRHIQNEVRVKDGETIILGGLRRKSRLDHEEKIPFLGYIPGLGKLFGTSRLTKHDTEMFFFITPKIIYDPEELAVKNQMAALQKRPGDIPEYLCKIEEARQKEKIRLFNQNIETFFTHGN